MTSAILFAWTVLVIFAIASRNSELLLDGAVVTVLMYAAYFGWKLLKRHRRPVPMVDLQASYLEAQPKH